MGLLGLLFKGYRFIFIVISLETMMIGRIIYLIGVTSEVLFFLLLRFSLISRVLALLILVNLVTSYGREYVKF